MNNPFVESPDVRLKDAQFCLRNEMSSGHKIMSLCLKQGRVRLLYIKAHYHETKQSIFRLFLSIDWLSRKDSPF